MSGNSHSDLVKMAVEKLSLLKQAKKILDILKHHEVSEIENMRYRKELGEIAGTLRLGVDELGKALAYLEKNGDRRIILRGLLVGDESAYEETKIRTLPPEFREKKVSPKSLLHCINKNCGMKWQFDGSFEKSTCPKCGGKSTGR